MPQNNNRISRVSLDFVLSKKVVILPSDKIPHIYFLIDDDEIVYIGQSIEVMKRIDTHKAKKKFNAYTHFNLTEKPFNCNYALDDIEAYYILKFKPKYNKTVPSNNLFWTKAQIKNNLNELQHRKYHCMGTWVNKVFREFQSEITTINFNGFVYYDRLEFLKYAKIINARLG